MFYKLMFVTGPSGSGKTHLLNELRKREIADLVLVDADDVWNRTDDGIRNGYSIERMKQFCSSGKPREIAVVFGLSRNILEVLNSFKNLKTEVGGPNRIFVIRPGVDTIVQRRTQRGKPFDRSLDSNGHRKDVRSFDGVLAQVPTTTLKTSEADEFIRKALA